MTIRCYKNFIRPLAIGFDLDDTLYDNGPVLKRAEHELQQHLISHFSRSANMTFQDWFALRQQVVATNPALANDIGQTRIAALTKGLCDLGYDTTTATAGANNAMAVFLGWRNTIDISCATHQLLAKLAQHYRLFAISNGNACPEALDLKQYFEFALHADINHPMKPAQQLFDLANSKLNLAPAQILYIGDHPVSDVVGASRASWQTGWINPTGQRIDHRKKSLLLPTFEFNQLSDLTLLCP